MALVADLAVAWAQRDDETFMPWLVDDFSHDIFGTRPSGEISEVVVLSAINHGREASCDGYLVFADASAVLLRFSHVFVFSSTTKTAKVKALRTDLVGEGG